jgi:diadenylate cyclase
MLNMRITDIIDILIISLAIYLVLIFIKQTRTYLIFESFAVLFGLNFIAEKLNLELTRQLIQPLLAFFVVVIIIVFQPELRRFIKWIGSGQRIRFDRVLSLPRKNIDTIVRAVFEMAKRKMGAIIVLPGEYDLIDMLEGGFILNGAVSAAILLSIFNSSTPGHDGAVLIEGSEIKMFGLHLPLARDFTEYRRVGTRHRAAAGITERTDAMSIIVSEERGEVSISTKGQLIKVKTPYLLQLCFG